MRQLVFEMYQVQPEGTKARSDSLNARWLKQIFLLGALAIFLLAMSRVVYEGVFPAALWLGNPWAVVPLVAVGCGLLWYTAAERLDAISVWPFIPLLLNLFVIAEPQVDLVGSRLWLGGSVWLCGVLLTAGWWQGRPWRLALWLVLTIAPVYLLTMSRTVGAADTFEFQVTAPVMGVVHPTGYPLYLILGKLWTLLPFGSVAWRLNVGTAVYGLGAAVGVLWLVYLLVRGEDGKLAGLTALVAAVAFALRPTFWSQAIAAEVYSLHNLIVVSGLLLIVYPLLGNDTEAQGHREEARSGVDAKAQRGEEKSSKSYYVYLAGLIGLGLTNHLTTVILIPAAVLSFIFPLTQSKIQNPKSKILRSLPAFLLPLTLYAYLPLRWRAVNNEPMGWGRFIAWVTGDQFQDALQLWGWWRDPTRYAVVGRLFVAEWGWWGLGLAAVGLLYLLWRNWRSGVILLITWLGFTFYCLNYYVPDLNVFLLPAQLIIGVCFGLGVFALCQVFSFQRSAVSGQRSALPLFVLIPILFTTSTHWPQIDQSQNDGLTTWGMGVLARPLEENGVILADGEKIAPLFYLQRAEGHRPDLDIKVLPHEAAYRAELGMQIDAGRTVYLGRFVPGLEGHYHLRSAGPLTEVGTEPLLMLPEVDISTNIQFEGIRLLGADVEPEAAVDPHSTAVTFYWQAAEPPDERLYVYVRWADGKPVIPTGQHPANSYYPTVAWEAGEIVPDFHLLPHPYPRPQTAGLQVALAPPFTPADELPWETVTTISSAEFQTKPEGAQATRIVWENGYLQGVAVPAQARPQSDDVLVTAVGERLDELEFGLLGLHVWGGIELDTAVPNGRYTVAARPESGTISCGWLRVNRPFCSLGTIEISGVPLPEDATNYGDKIALLDVAVPETELQPGGIFNVTLRWQALAPIAEDYTVFVQVLNEQDQIVGQVDAWPLQGTHPTSGWEVGELIENDPYAVQLDENLPAGNYRLIVGLYRLADFQRLPVLDGDGSPVDDKFVRPGLMVTE